MTAVTSGRTGFYVEPAHSFLLSGTLQQGGVFDFSNGRSRFGIQAELPAPATRSVPTRTRPPQASQATNSMGTGPNAALPTTPCSGRAAAPRLDHDPLIERPIRRLQRRHRQRGRLKGGEVGRQRFVVESKQSSKRPQGCSQQIRKGGRLDAAPAPPLRRVCAGTAERSIPPQPGLPSTCQSALAAIALARRFVVRHHFRSQMSSDLGQSRSSHFRRRLPGRPRERGDDWRLSSRRSRSPRRRHRRAARATAWETATTAPPGGLPLPGRERPVHGGGDAGSKVCP